MKGWPWVQRICGTVGGIIILLSLGADAWEWIRTRWMGA